MNLSVKAGFLVVRAKQHSPPPPPPLSLLTELCGKATSGSPDAEKVNAMAWAAADVLGRKIHLRIVPRRVVVFGQRRLLRVTVGVYFYEEIFSKTWLIRS